MDGKNINSHRGQGLGGGKAVEGVPGRGVTLSGTSAKGVLLLALTIILEVAGATCIQTHTLTHTLTHTHTHTLLLSFSKSPSLLVYI